MRIKSSIAVTTFFALASLGCSSGDRKPPDSPAGQASDNLETLTNEQLAARLYELTREPRFRENLLLSLPEVSAQAPPVQDRLEEVTRELSAQVTSDYLAFYDRPTLLAAVRFFDSEAGRTYVLREPGLNVQVTSKEHLWARHLQARTAAATAFNEPRIDVAADAAPHEAAPAGAEPSEAPSRAEDSPPIPGTPGEIARAKKTCKEPALGPLPQAEPAETLRRLTGRWYACSGKFDLTGQVRPQAAAGIEFTSNGGWYLLDASANGVLVRRVAKDMRDLVSGTIIEDTHGLQFTFDPSSTGTNGLMAQLVFASTVPALDFDQTRLVRVDPQ